jgi:hypothetical protein
MGNIQIVTYGYNPLIALKTRKRGLTEKVHAFSNCCLYNILGWWDLV